MVTIRYEYEYLRRSSESFMFYENHFSAEDIHNCLFKKLCFPAICCGIKKNPENNIKLK